MAINDLSDLVNLLTGGNNGTPEKINFFKDNRVGAAAAAAPIAGRMTSLWEYNGHPSHGVAPGASWINYDNASDGGLKQTDPGGGRTKRLLAFFGAPNAIGGIILYDRLGAISGLSGTSTSAQSVSSSINRYTSGADAEGGNQVWIEIWTQIGASGTTITMNYTDQDGNSGITSPAVAIGNTGLREAQRIIPMPLAAGDRGVQAVNTVTLAATTGTAGNFGVAIVRPIMVISCPAAGTPAGRDTLSDFPSMPEIKTDACLAMAWLANGTTIPQILSGFAMFVEK
jgi:hypothetical protein